MSALTFRAPTALDTYLGTWGDAALKLHPDGKFANYAKVTAEAALWLGWSSAKIKLHADRPRKDTAARRPVNRRWERLAVGQTTPPPPQVVVVRQGHSGCFWFLIFLLIGVVIVGIVILLSVMGILGALFG
jgi:hypothetical protein